MNKKAIYRMGLGICIVLTLIGLVFFVFSTSLTNALSLEKKYNLGDKISLDLSEFTNYNLKIFTPKESFVYKGSSKLSLKLTEIGEYKLVLTHDGVIDNYIFNVVEGTKTQTNESTVQINNQTSVNENNELDNESVKINSKIEKKSIVNGNEIKSFIDTPKSSERILSNSIKEVRINSSENYSSVLIYTNVTAKIKNKDLIKVYWEEKGEYVSFSAFDKDGDGFLDYLEWKAPISTEGAVFDIIFVSRAEHLDSGRNFIKEVYEEIASRDGVYTSISNGEFLRVKFERNLTKVNDITIYAKGNGNVKVYEKDKNTLIADFGQITEDKNYKIILSNLVSTQDTFDLQVSGNVDFDYVVDPVASFTDAAATGTISTTSTAPNTLATLTSSIPSSANLILGAIQVISTDAGSESIAAGAIDLNGGTTLLATNEYAFQVSSADTSNNYFIMGVDNSSPAAGKVYNITAYSSATAVNTEAKVVILSGITNWGFNDSASTAFSTTEIPIATVPTTFSAGNNVIIAAIQIDNGATAQDIAAGNIKIKNGGTTLTSNQFALSLANSAPGDVQQIVLLALDSGAAANSTYNITITGAQSGVAEAKVIVFRTTNASFVDGGSVAAGSATNIAGVQTSFAAGSDMVVIGATQFDDTDSQAETLTATTGLVLTENGTSVSNNELIMSGFAASGNAGDGIRHTLIWRNSSIAASPRYNISATTSASGLNGEAKILALQISAPDTTVPQVSITYPVNGTRYNSVITALNYTVVETNPNSCWYSTDRGTTNSSSVLSGLNFTGLTSTEGMNNWSVYCNDTRGNFNTSIVNFFQDTVIPLIQYVAPTETNATYITRNNIVVNVTATDTNLANITVRLYNSTFSVINTTNKTTSPVFLNFTALADGIYYFNATVYDLSSNVNNTLTNKVTVDTTTPLIQYVTPSESNNSNLTRSNIVVNVTASDTNLANITVRLYNSTFSIINTTNTTTSPLFLNFTSLSDGIYYFNATVYDLANKVNNTLTNKITIDTTNPSAQYVAPTETNATYITRNNIVVNVTASDTNLANITVRFYNSTFSIINTTNTTTSPLFLNFTSLSDGIYYFNATAYDTFVNFNITQTNKVTVDTTTPLIQYVTPSESNNSNLTRSNIVVNVTASDTNLANITVRLYNSTFSIINTTNTTTSPLFLNFTSLSDGIYYFNATVYDLANKVNNTQTNKVIIDTINPSIQYVTPSETNATYITRNNIVVNVTATDTNLANITVRFYNSTSLVNTTTSATSPLFLNFTALSDGIYYFNATAYDTFVHFNITQTNRVTVDTTTPNIQYVTPSESNNSNLTRSNIVVNVTATDTNLANITVRLYNSTFSLINSTNTTTSPLFLNFTSLSDGIYYFNATVYDLVNKVNNTQTNKVTIDTTVPSIQYVTPSESNNSNLTRNNIVVNVTATDTNLANITVRLYNSTFSVINTTNTTTSPLFLNFTSLSDGIYYFNATAYDTFGNFNNTQTNKVTIATDTTPPSIQYVAPSESNNSYLRRSNIVVNVTATDVSLANITVRLYNSTFSIINTTNTTTSPLFLNFTSLSDGIYYFNATAYDTANNVNNTLTNKVTVDTTIPSAQYVTPTESNNSYLRRTNIVVNVTASDTNLANITVRFYNSTFSIINSTNITTSPLFLNFTGLSDGIYYFNATVYDLANNVNNTQTNKVTVDTTIPNIQYVTPSESNNSNLTRNNIVVNVTATDTNLANITVRFYNSTFSIINTTNTTTSPLFLNFTALSDGIYYFNATVYDLANNVNNTLTNKVTIDTTNPSIQYVAPSETNATYITRNNIVVNVTASDTNLANITVRLYNSTFSIINTTNTTTSPLFLNFTALSDGIYYFNATAYDTFLHLSNTQTNKVTIDTITPLISFINPTSTNASIVTSSSIFANVSITETNFANITFVLYNSTSLVNRTTYSSLTTSINWTGLPTDLTYYYNVTVYDLAVKSNSTETRTISLTNGVPPTISVLSPFANGSFFNSSSILFNISLSESGNAAWYTLDSGINNITMSTTNNINYNASNTSISDGAYIVFFYANDSFGNLGSTSRTFGMDRVSPLISYAAFGNRDDYSNVSTSSISVNVSLTESNFANITYVLYNSTSLVNRTTYSSLTTTINWNGLPNEAYTYNVTVGDNASNYNNTLTRHITLDTLNPNSLLFSPANNTYFNVDSVNLSVNSTDLRGLSNATLFIYNSTTLVNSTNTNVFGTSSIASINYTFLYSGTYFWSYQVFDSAGNTNITTNNTLTIDLEKPIIVFVPLTESNASEFERTSIFANVSITESNFANMSYVLYNSTTLVNQTNYSSLTTSINWTNLSSLNVTYYYNVTVYDLAGNVNTSERRTTKLVDITPPNLTIVNPLNTSYDYAENLPLDFIVQDAHLDSCWYSVDSGAITILPGCANTTFNSNDGEHTLYLFANDSFNLTSVKNVTFFVNATLVTSEYRVKSGSLTLSAQANATLESKFDKTKSFILLTSRSGISTPDVLLATVNFTNSTQIAFYNYAGVANISWQVITGPDLSVQRGDLTYNSTDSEFNITLDSAVNLSSSFALINSRLNSALANLYNQGLWGIKLINETMIRVDRASTGSAGTLSWQVVDWINTSVQNGSTIVSATTAAQSLTQNVNDNSSFLIFSNRISGASGEDDIFALGSINTTSVFFSRGNGGSGTYTADWFVVSNDKIRVRRALALSGASISVDVNIPTLVNTSKSFVLNTQNSTGVGTTNGDGHVTSNITNNTNLNLLKGLTSTSNSVLWQTIEFVEIDPPIVELRYPSNGQNFSSWTITQFNYSVNDSSSIANCSLYGNWTIGWHLNQTVMNPGKAVENNFSSITVNESKFYSWNVLCTDVYGNVGYNSTNFSFGAFLSPNAPIIYNITQNGNDGNGNITLYWNDGGHGYTYNIYYSSNLSSFTLLNSTSNTNYTDTTFSGSRRRFYLIQSVNPSGQNSSINYFGAQVYTLAHSSSNSKNWIGIVTNISNITSANQSLYEITNATSFNMWNATNQVRVTCNKFSCPSSPSCTDTNCNFALTRGAGYEANVNLSAPNSFNWSSVGIVYTQGNISLVKNATSTGKNWISLYGNSTLTYAKNLMDNITKADSVSMWNATSQASVGLIPSPFPFGPRYLGTNFSLELERGYEISVNTTINWTGG